MARTSETDSPVWMHILIIYTPSSPQQDSVLQYIFLPLGILIRYIPLAIMGSVAFECRQLPRAPGSQVDFGVEVTGLDVENVSGE